jgi:hypothetical protein
MTTLHQYKPSGKFQVAIEPEGSERREHRRHDLEQQGINIDRWDGARRGGETFGQIVDLSAGGVRIRTEPDTSIRADQQSCASSSRFTPHRSLHRCHEQSFNPREWSAGWRSRVSKRDDSCDIMDDC